MSSNIFTFVVHKVCIQGPETMRQYGHGHDLDLLIFHIIRNVLQREKCLSSACLPYCKNISETPWASFFTPKSFEKIRIYNKV